MKILWSSTFDRTRNVIQPLSAHYILLSNDNYVNVIYYGHKILMNIDIQLPGSHLEIDNSIVIKVFSKDNVFKFVWFDDCKVFIKNNENSLKLV